MGKARGDRKREKKLMGGEIERERTVFRKEYGADAKPTGDSPGAGTVVCV